MTERDTKKEVLNLRLGDTLSFEISRLAERRGLSASEVARELLEHGVRVERQIEAQELHRHYTSDRIDRSAGTIEINARFRFYTRLEIEQQDWDADDWDDWERAQAARQKAGEQ
jgi:hypothetical protein